MSNIFMEKYMPPKIESNRRLLVSPSNSFLITCILCHHHFVSPRSLNSTQGKFKPAVARVARTIREFDDAITIHSFGWENTDQYYAGSSSSKVVSEVSSSVLDAAHIIIVIILMCTMHIDAAAASNSCIRASYYCICARMDKWMMYHQYYNFHDL